MCNRKQIISFLYFECIRVIFLLQSVYLNFLRNVIYFMLDSITIFICHFILSLRINACGTFLKKYVLRNQPVNRTEIARTNAIALNGTRCINKNGSENDSVNGFGVGRLCLIAVVGTVDASKTTLSRLCLSEASTHFVRDNVVYNVGTIDSSGPGLVPRAFVFGQLAVH